MKFLRRYYNELFSLCVFSPLVILGMRSGVVGGIGIAGFLTFFAAIIFRNNYITAFSVLLLIPFLVFGDVSSFFGIGPTAFGSLISLVFYLFCSSFLHKKNWIWMWYIPVWLFGFELLGSISFDILKDSTIFVAFFSLTHLFLALSVPRIRQPAEGIQKTSMLPLDPHLRGDDTITVDKPVLLRFFAFLFSTLLFELFWVIRVLPLGVFLGSLFIVVFFYFITHLYRGYILEKPIQYYIRPSAFTFLLLLAILITAIKTPF
ncbi:MAG: hypothetical protein HZA35_02995 [Parcubacteria group bacterium]|nr:hypothetical protein [Parcubacteria group bacterium]